MKEGYKTTEFWLTLLAQLLGVAVLFGVINAEQVKTLNDAIAVAVQAVVGLWVAVAPLVEYIKSRAAVKTSAEFIITKALEE